MFEGLFSVFNQSSENYMAILKVITSFSFVFAILQCFFGLKLFKALVAFSGIAVGAVVGIKLGVMLNITLLSIMFAVILAIAGGYFAVKFYKAGVFINGFGSGMLFLFVLIGFRMELYLLAVFFGIVIGILSVIFIKPMIMATSAISGGIVISSCILSLIMSKPMLILEIILAVVFILAGGYVQYKLDKKYTK